MTDSAPDRSPTAGDDERWREHLLQSPAQIHALLGRVHRIAVLGIKPESTGAPAAFVPAYAIRAGYEVIPVPVYYPEAKELHGRPVYRRLADIPGPVDLVNVFRRSSDVPPHLDDILAAKPKAVWMQSGIRNEAVAEQLARHGIDVVQDRCLMVELSAIGR